MPRTTSPMSLASDERSHARRILLLVHRVPYPPDKGDRIRSYHLLVHLARLGHVDLAFLSDEPTGWEPIEDLDRLCRRVMAVPVSRVGRWFRAAWSLAIGRSLTEGLFRSPGLEKLLDRWLCDTTYDAIVVFSSGVLPYVLGLGLDHRLVVDLVDVDSQKWLDYASKASGPIATLFRLEGRRVRALEGAATDCRAVVLATETEAKIYRTYHPTARVEEIPNGVDLDYFRPEPDGPEGGGCVFVGQLDYRANILGLDWFCREAWPLVRGSLPDATFRIVGRNPVASVRRLASFPGVEFVGPVADVRPELARARIVVVPLPVARGVQNKVLEAMAMGKAVVASTAALDGLGLQPGRDALAATDPNDWRHAIVGLWVDRKRRAELGRAARRYVEASHHWETCFGRFDSLIGGEVVGGGMGRETPPVVPPRAIRS